MAKGFDSKASGILFCDGGICNYRGRIFVHLRQASVAGEVARGWIRYDGLRSYTAALGAPDTIPEFSEVSLSDYPLVLSAHEAMLNFKPSSLEKRRYLNPILLNYDEALKAYYNRIFQLDINHLNQRLESMRQMAAPFLGGKVVMVGYDASDLKTTHVPESMVKSLPTLLDASEKDTLNLTQEIDKVMRSNMPDVRANFLSYTQAWLGLSETNNECVVNSAGSPDRVMTDEFHYYWSLDAAFEPWCTLRSWTLYEIPRLDSDGRPIRPDWWGKYQQHLRANGPTAP
jgi:hypothetical protein